MLQAPLRTSTEATRGTALINRSGSDRACRCRPSDILANRPATLRTECPSRACLHTHQCRPFDVPAGSGQAGLVHAIFLSGTASSLHRSSPAASASSKQSAAVVRSARQLFTWPSSHKDHPEHVIVTPRWEGRTLTRWSPRSIRGRSFWSARALGRQQDPPADDLGVSSSTP
jgi:hypothetical protein